MTKAAFAQFSLRALVASILISSGIASLFAQQKTGAGEIISPKTYPLKFDKDLGAAAAHLGEGKLHQVDVTIVEIPPGGKLPAHKHLAEEMILILSGKGYTEMWNGKTGKKQKYEWSEGDMLSPSLNSWHQHVNSSTSAPARFLSVTTTPLTTNVFNNSAFVGSDDFTFDDRWNKAIHQEPEHYGNAKTGPDQVRMAVGHLLPDLRNRKMEGRGGGMLGITLDPEGDMAGNRLLEVELREFTNPEATSPEHRHYWETVYFILKGEGYATLQKEDGPNRRIDWKEGDLFLVEANEFHNHRPVSLGSRFLQIKASGYFRRVGLDKWMMQDKPGTKVVLP